MRFSVPLLSAVAALATIAPAAAAPNQQRLAMSCTGSTCTGTSAAVPAGKTLKLETISCQINSASAMSLNGGGSVFQSDLPNGPTQSFGFNFIMPTQLAATVQPLSLVIPAGKRAGVKIVLNNTVTAFGCTVTGQMLP